MQARDLALGLLPIDVLDGFGVVFDFLAPLAQRECASVDLDLRSLVVGHRCGPGVIRMGELDLQRDVALFVLAELRLQSRKRVDIRELRRLEGLELDA